MVSKLIRSTVKQTTPLLILFAFIQLTAGTMLGDIVNNMSYFPGILILLPPLLAMRGNIGSSLGARLSSALHLGYVRPNKITNSLKINIYSGLILSFIMSALLAVFTFISCGLTQSICLGFVSLAMISISVGFISGFIMVFLAVVITEFSYKRGLDPDNVTSPTISTAGDVITIMVFILIIRLFLMLGLV